MEKKQTILITGVSLEHQEQMAEEILQNEVIPKVKAFEEKKKNGTLSKKLKTLLKEDA